MSGAGVYVIKSKLEQSQIAEALIARGGAVYDTKVVMDGFRETDLTMVLMDNVIFESHIKQPIDTLVIDAYQWHERDHPGTNDTTIVIELSRKGPSAEEQVRQIKTKLGRMVDAGVINRTDFNLVGSSHSRVTGIAGTHIRVVFKPNTPIKAAEIIRVLLYRCQLISPPGSHPAYVTPRAVWERNADGYLARMTDKKKPEGDKVKPRREEHRERPREKKGDKPRGKPKEQQPQVQLLPSQAPLNVSYAVPPPGILTLTPQPSITPVARPVVQAVPLPNLGAGVPQN
jgi:hypothetical protein